jgi:hypothetical protein
MMLWDPEGADAGAVQVNAEVVQVDAGIRELEKNILSSVTNSHIRHFCLPAVLPEQVVEGQGEVKGVHQAQDDVVGILKVLGSYRWRWRSIGHLTS